MTGKATENLKREVGRTLQNTDICGDLKKNVCKRENCNRRHVKPLERLQCFICTYQISTDTFGAVSCGHILCYNCALRILSDTVNTDNSLKICCPQCKCIGKYKKLM